MKRHSIVFFLGVILLATPAFGAEQRQVYEWVDSTGTMNFTDSLDNVPRQYRNSVKKRKVVPLVPITSPGSREPAPSVRSDRTPRDGEFAEWRSRFSVLRAEMTRLSIQLEEKRKSLANLHRQRVLFQRPTDRVASTELAAEVERDEKRLKELNESFAALKAEADRLGVPQEWR